MNSLHCRVYERCSEKRTLFSRGRRSAVQDVLGRYRVQLLQSERAYVDRIPEQCPALVEQMLAERPPAATPRHPCPWCDRAGKPGETACRGVLMRETVLVLGYRTSGKQCFKLF